MICRHAGTLTRGAVPPCVRPSALVNRHGVTGRPPPYLRGLMVRRRAAQKWPPVEGASQFAIRGGHRASPCSLCSLILFFREPNDRGSAAAPHDRARRRRLQPLVSLRVPEFGSCGTMPWPPAPPFARAEVWFVIASVASPADGNWLGLPRRPAKRVTASADRSSVQSPRDHSPIARAWGRWAERWPRAANWPRTPTAVPRDHT